MPNSELKCLSEMPMFHDVGMPKLKLVAMAGLREMHPAGDVIAEMDEPPAAVFIVLEGEVNLTRRTDDGVVTIARRGVGYIIGDIPVLLGEPYPVTVTAITPVTVLRLDAYVFMQLVNEVPQFSMALMRDLAQRVVRMGKLYVEANA